MTTKRKTNPLMPLVPKTPDALRPWLEARREALQKKMQREQAYLARRAKRGTHTPTDDAYEADQLLEADLLALIDAILIEVRESEGTTEGNE